MILSIKNLSCFTDVEHDRKPIEFLFVINDRRRTKMFSYDKMSRCSFLSNKWLLLVGSCSALDEGFIKGRVLSYPFVVLSCPVCRWTDNKRSYRYMS